MILLITSRVGGHTRTNLSCWYVREPHRKYAGLLYLHALKPKHTTFLNLSPASHVTPIIETLGFRPYTSGVVLMDGRWAMKADSKANRIRPYTPATATALTACDVARAERHIAYGCSALVAEVGGRARLVVYRMRKLRDLVPCAQMLWGRPSDIIEVAPKLFRYLLPRGVPFLLFDVPLGEEAPPVGRFYSGQHVRYFKGEAPPETGDLCDTELAILGP
jgi:hypothetical protein